MKFFTRILIDWKENTIYFYIYPYPYYAVDVPFREQEGSGKGRQTTKEPTNP